MSQAVQIQSQARLQAWLAAQRAGADAVSDVNRPITYTWDQDAACLLVDYSGLLGNESMHAVGDWASGFATVRCNDGLFERGCVMDLGLPFGPAHPDPAFRHWFATIPSTLARVLAPLPARHYALARLAQQAPAVQDLLFSNVNLGYLLHYVASARADPEPVVIDLAARKQTEILRELGLPPQRRVVKLLRKVQMHEFDEPDVPGLLRLLSDQAICDALVHEPRLTKRLCQVLTRYPWMAGQPIQYLLCETSGPTLREWINDSIRMDGEAAVQAMRRFDRISQLRRLHDRLIATQMRAPKRDLCRYDAVGRSLPFPPAPFADTEMIQAIRTPEALRRETEEMAHCVSSYSERIYDGRYAVYRVLAPERLTLGLKLHEGSVAFDQLRGVANQAPSQAARAAVEQWLHDCLEEARQ